MPEEAAPIVEAGKGDGNAVSSQPEDAPPTIDPTAGALGEGDATLLPEQDDPAATEAAGSAPSPLRMTSLLAMADELEGIRNVVIDNIRTPASPEKRPLIDPPLQEESAQKHDEGSLKEAEDVQREPGPILEATEGTPALEEVGSSDVATSSEAAAAAIPNPDHPATVAKLAKEERPTVVPEEGAVWATMMAGAREATKATEEAKKSEAGVDDVAGGASAKSRNANAGPAMAMAGEGELWTTMMAGAAIEYATNGPPHADKGQRFWEGKRKWEFGHSRSEEIAIWDDLSIGAHAAYVTGGAEHPHRRNRFYEGRRHEEDSGLVQLLAPMSGDDLMMLAVEGQKVHHEAGGKGDTKEIEKLFEASLRADPRHMQSLVRYGIFLMGLDKLDKASTYLARALEIDAPERLHAERAHKALSLKIKMRKKVRVVKSLVGMGAMMGAMTAHPREDAGNEVIQQEELEEAAAASSAASFGGEVSAVTGVTPEAPASTPRPEPTRESPVLTLQQLRSELSRIRDEADKARRLAGEMQREHQSEVGSLREQVRRSKYELLTIRKAVTPHLMRYPEVVAQAYITAQDVQEAATGKEPKYMGHAQHADPQLDASALEAASNAKWEAKEVERLLGDMASASASVSLWESLVWGPCPSGGSPRRGLHESCMGVDHGGVFSDLLLSGLELDLAAFGGGSREWKEALAPKQQGLEEGASPELQGSAACSPSGHVTDECLVSQWLSQLSDDITASTAAGSSIDKGAEPAEEGRLTQQGGHYLDALQACFPPSKVSSYIVFITIYGHITLDSPPFRITIYGHITLDSPPFRTLYPRSLAI